MSEYFLLCEAILGAKHLRKYGFACLNISAGNERSWWQEP